MLDLLLVGGGWNFLKFCCDFPEGGKSNFPQLTSCPSFFRGVAKNHQPLDGF